MTRNGWIGIKTTGNGRKWNSRTMLEIAGNCYKQLEMTKIGVNCYTMLKMAVNSWKWQERPRIDYK